MPDRPPKIRVLCALLMLVALAILTLPAQGRAAEGNAVEAAQLAPLDSFNECDQCPEMIVLPLGHFVMGASEQEARDAYRASGLTSADGERYHAQVQTPQRQIEVDLPIAMGRTEVTRAQWQMCVEAGVCAKGLKDRPNQGWRACVISPDCTASPDDRLRFRLQKGPHQWHPDSPMVMLTHAQVREYIGWLNAKVGRNAYRLPTEPEWEYAARAGTTTPYIYGDVPTRAQANFSIVHRSRKNGKTAFHYDPQNHRMPIPVDQLQAANGWGLRHMAGNVAERTRSCWSDRHLSFATTSRHLAASFRPLGCKRTYKDGSFGSPPSVLRPARRLAMPQGNTHDWLGFRVVRDMRLPLAVAP